MQNTSNYSLVILAAGKGTRLGDLTFDVNKCLLPINNKAVISYIIEKVPQECEVIIALGYKKKSIMEYCLAAHPNRKFLFVEVDNWQGSLSGPGESLLACEEYLQKPFYLCTSDCIVEENFPSLDYNWLGIHPTKNCANYSTLEIDADKNIINFKNKDKNGFNLAFIGLAGIKDYTTFWKKLKQNNFDQEKELVSAFYDPKMYTSLKAEMFSWHDTGSSEGYKATCNYFNTKKYSIPKTTNEITFFDNKKCIKFIGDAKRIEGRIKRSEILKNIIPELTYKGEFIYAYDWVNGDTLYELDQFDAYCNFFDWCKENFWKKINNIKNFESSCYQFYHDKTLIRLNSFLSKKDNTYTGSHVVNNKLCVPIHSYLEKIDWDFLANGVPVKFHGDLQFDNVIFDGKKYTLLDWRECFADRIDCGDLYYDLSKLYGGILIPYNKMKYSENYFYSADSNSIICEWQSNKNLKKVKLFFEKWIKDNGYDLFKVKLITSLIFLNMSALHEDNFENILFFQSKLMLEEIFGK